MYGVMYVLLQCNMRTCKSSKVALVIVWFSGVAIMQIALCGGEYWFRRLSEHDVAMFHSSPLFICVQHQA